MRPQIYFLFYVSTATRHFSKADLLELLAKSRTNNAKVEVTGMLLYKDDQFQQVIEGPETAVKTLFAKIKGDPRHHGVITALDGYEEERQFTDWSMGFCDLTTDEAKATPGYNEFLNSSLTDPRFVNNPNVCYQFMMMFKNHTRNR